MRARVLYFEYVHNIIFFQNIRTVDLVHAIYKKKKCLCINSTPYQPFDLWQLLNCLYVNVVSKLETIIVATCNVDTLAKANIHLVRKVRFYFFNSNKYITTCPPDNHLSHEFSLNQVEHFHCFLLGLRNLLFQLLSFVRNPGIPCPGTVPQGKPDERKILCLQS